MTKVMLFCIFLSVFVFAKDYDGHESFDQHFANALSNMKHYFDQEGNEVTKKADLQYTFKFLNCHYNDAFNWPNNSTRRTLPVSVT